MSGSNPPWIEGLAGWVVKHRKSALVPDTSQDDRWTKRGYTDGVQQGPKSTLCAPLIARDQLVGVITFTHKETNHYDQEHLDLVQTIADQAAIAALNAQLYQASQRRANVMSILAETAAAITSTLELDEVFSRILESTSSALGADSVLLGLINRSTNEVELTGAFGREFPPQGWSPDKDRRRDRRLGGRKRENCRGARCGSRRTVQH